MCKKFLRLDCATDLSTLANLKVQIQRTNVNGEVKTRFEVINTLTLEQSIRDIAVQIQLSTVDGLNFAGYQFSLFSWRVRSTDSIATKW